MLLCISGFLLIALFDFLPLIRRKKWRAAFAFMVLFSTALLIEVLTTLNIKVPSAMYGAEALVRWVGLGYAP
jgi:putative effector of murein hydrolase